MLFFILRLSCNTRDVFVRAHVPLAEASDLATAHAEPTAKTSLFRRVCSSLVSAVTSTSLSTLPLESVTIWPLVGSGTWQSTR